MSDLKSVFSRQLRSYRGAALMSQEELAQKTGMSVDAIGKYERGEVLPLFERVCQLAEALNCTPNDLCAFPAKDSNGGK